MPTSLFEHLSTDQENHRRKKDHTQRSPCSLGPFASVATACVSSPRDWAVSISLHMQQDMVISLAPLHLGAPSYRSALTAIHWQWPSLGICLRRSSEVTVVFNDTQCSDFFCGVLACIVRSRNDLMTQKEQLLVLSSGTFSSGTLNKLCAQSVATRGVQTFECS